MKVIFFDLFETLVTHFDPEWTPPPRSIAQRLGLEDGAFDESWRTFDTSWQRGEVSTYRDALAQVCLACGGEPDEDVVSQLVHEYQQMTGQVFSRIEPDIIELVTTLKHAGYSLEVITNAGDLDAAPWFTCPLAPLFDDFLASHCIGLLKRDTAIFDLACDRLGVWPSEAIFVGDGGGDELAGATRAGLTAYWCSWFLDR